MSSFPLTCMWRVLVFATCAPICFASAVVRENEPAQAECAFVRVTVDEMRTISSAQEMIGAGAAVPVVTPFMQLPPQDVAGPSTAPDGAAAQSPPTEIEPPQPLAPPLLQSFAGTADDNTTVPPNTMGAAGSGNHLVIMLNSGFTVYSRTGVLLSPQVSLQTFWSALGTGAGEPARRVYDPKIIFDQYSESWITIANGNPRNFDGSGNSWLLVGISETSDPTGDWNLFGIKADEAVSHPDDWPDYPGIGVDPNNLIISNNMFTQAGNTYVHSDVWVIEKAEMIAGGALVQGVDYALFHNPSGAGGSTYQPCHTFGQLAGSNVVNYLVHQGWQSGADRYFRVQMITGVGASAVLNNFGGDDWIQVDSYNFTQNDAPQPGGCVPIETNETRLLNAVWRSGRIYTTHSVADASGKTEVAWYEIDPVGVGAFPGGVPIQQGRVRHNALYYYYPSIAANRVGCVALGFNGSDADTYASSYYTLRQAAEPAGTMQPVALLKAGQDTYNKNFTDTQNRWGDFSATVIDPVDDTTFWTFQQHAETSVPSGSCADDTGRWGTWIGSFTCSTTPPTDILGRHLFYNESYYDGNNGAINPGANAGTNHDHDDDAIDPTKSPLLPGDGVAQIPNWTGFDDGITGLMFDVVNPTAAPTAADFTFTDLGKDGLGATAVVPDAFLVRPGAGIGGSDRVVVTFSGLVNTWLEVRIGTGFGLPSPDVSYWGNAAGDGQSPGSPSLILVDGADIVGARDNSHTILNRALVQDEYDYSKDTLVDGTDIAYARDHTTSILTAVRRISR